MHTRSAKSKTTGKFTVTVTDWNGVECFRGEFENMVVADLCRRTGRARNDAADAGRGADA